MGNRRSAARRKCIHRRIAEQNGSQREKFSGRSRDDRRHVNYGGIHQAVGEQRDGALVFNFAGVRMEAFMERRRRRQRVQQQDNGNQQAAKNRPH